MLAHQLLGRAAPEASHAAQRKASGMRVSRVMRVALVALELDEGEAVRGAEELDGCDESMAQLCDLGPHMNVVKIIEYAFI